MSAATGTAGTVRAAPNNEDRDVQDDSATTEPTGDVVPRDACGKVWTLSTAHISEHEMALLTRLGTHAPSGRYGETTRPHADVTLPRVVAHEWGAIVYVIDDDDEDLVPLLARMRELHLDELARIYALAVASNVAMLDLDAEGPVLETLPVHDW